MTPATRIALAAIMLAASSAAAETLHLAGDGETLWLAASENNVYSLAVKTPAKGWERFYIRAVGQIQALAAIDGSAAVFFADGVHVRYDAKHRTGFRGIKPPGDLWPAGTMLLSACPAADGQDGSMLVLAERPGPAGAATAAAAAPPPDADPGQPELTLLRYAQGQWQQLSSSTLTQTPGRAHMAKLDKTLYILLEGPPAGFLAVEENTWKPLQPPALEQAKPLALLRAGGKILLAARTPRPGQVALTPYEQGNWLPAKVLCKDDAPFTWPEQSLPAVAGFGTGLALLWKEGESYLFASADLDGRLAEQTKDIFYRSRAEERLNQIVGGFFWAVPLVMIVLMLWPGQYPRTMLFALPPELRPAAPLKRLAAFVIDVLPFWAMAAAAIGKEQLEKLKESMAEGQVTLHVGLVMLAATVAFTIYCIVLERLFAATLGKLALGLRVVGQGGRKAGLRELALRNISKILELAVFPSLLVPLLTRYHRRLGDMAAWTAVIDQRLSGPAPPEPDRRRSDGQGPSGDQRP